MLLLLMMMMMMMMQYKTEKDGVIETRIEKRLVITGTPADVDHDKVNYSAMLYAVVRNNKLGLSSTATDPTLCAYLLLLLLLQPSSLRGLATPCTSCLHLARSSVYMRILSNVYPVHWKMLSIHVVFGLPLFRDPGVVPCIICFSELSELLRITCPKYVNFLAFTDSRRLLDTSALSSTQSFVRFAVHDIYLLRHKHSCASSCNLARK